MGAFSKYTFFLYLSLWILYQLQKILMLQGIVAQLIFIVLMAMSLYACYKVNRFYDTGPYIKWLNVIMVVLTFYGIIPIMTGETFYKHGFVSNLLSNYSYLQGIFISIMPIYAFYYYALEKQLSPKILTYAFFALLVFSLLSYFQMFLKETSNNDKEDIVNNIGYLFVPLIPMLSLVKLNKIWKYIFALSIFGIIMLSMKRGAILTGGIMMMLFIMHHFEVRTKTQLASAFSLLIAAMILIYRFISNMFETNLFFQKRVLKTMEGYTSGRDELYGFFWHHYTEQTSAWEFFFGHGANGTIALYGQYAHNDWLEFAINQGLLGVILYLIYWIVFTWEWKNYKGSIENRQALGDIIIAYFIIALFSMSFANMPIAATLCIGYCLAMNNQLRYITLYEDTNYRTRLS